MKRNTIIKFNDVAGKIYNHLTVESEDSPITILNSRGKSLQRRWNFRCVCGKLKSILPSNVFNNNIKSCGCKKREVIAEKTEQYYSKKYPNGEGVELRLFSSYKLSGKKFELSLQEFSSLINSNCHYCGDIPKKLRKNKTGTKTKLLNGVDRVNSKLGYNISNCVPCCKDCNFMKNNLDKDYFLAHIGKIYKWNNEETNRLV